MRSSCGGKLHNVGDYARAFKVAGVFESVPPAHNPRYAKCRAGRDWRGGCVQAVAVRGSPLGLVFALLIVV